MSTMKIGVQIIIELTNEDLAAMAVVKNKGPTNKKLAHKEVVEFWGQYIHFAVGQARRRNKEYAAMTPLERAQAEEEMQRELEKPE